MSTPRVPALAQSLAMLATILLVACQWATVTSSFPSVPAPKLGVGDQWLYKITDNLRMGQATMLVAEVVSIKAGTATLHLTYSNQYGHSETTAEIDAAGGMIVGALKNQDTRRFPAPIELYDFPLEPGKSWRQTVDTIGPETQLPAQILVYGNVQGQTVVTVPAGTFNAIYLYRILQLDDEQHWRTRTTREDAVWFDPEMKTAVREQRNAYYVENSGRSSFVNSERTTSELVSFQPGGTRP